MSAFGSSRIFKDFNTAHYLDPNAGVPPPADTGPQGGNDYCYIVAPLLSNADYGVEAVLFVEPALLGSVDSVTVDIWFHDQVGGVSDTWIPFSVGNVVTTQQVPIVLKVAANMQLYFRITAISGAPKSFRVAFRPSDGSGGSSLVQNSSGSPFFVQEVRSPRFEDGNNGNAWVRLQVTESDSNGLDNSGNNVPGSRHLLVKAYASGAADINAATGAITGAVLTNRNAAVRYCQIHNVAFGSVGTASIQRVIPVAANTTLFLGESEFGMGGQWFNSRTSFAWSTTEATYTAATGSEHSSEFYGN